MQWQDRQAQHNDAPHICTQLLAVHVCHSSCACHALPGDEVFMTASQVRESLRGATIDMKIQGHPLQAKVEEAQGQLQQLRRQLPSLRGRDRGLGHRDASRLRADVKALRAQLMSQV